MRSTPATGRPPTLTLEQEQQVLRWVNGNDPRQYGLDFGLWTRAVVGELIEQKFGVKLGLTAIGKLLAKLGLTPQKPLQRAYQRDPEAITAMAAGALSGNCQASEAGQGGYLRCTVNDGHSRLRRPASA